MADSLAVILNQPLDALALPTRMKNWAHRAGLQVLGDLAKQAPEALLAEPNLGRTSVKDTRRVIEAATGRRWEDLAADIQVEPGTTPPAAVFASPWDELRASLTPAQRALPLSIMAMPSRLRLLVEREAMTTLGDLAARSRFELRAAPNLGRSTIDQLPSLTRALFEAVEHAPTLIAAGLVGCFERVLTPLEPVLRVIATRRSGLRGDPATLQDLGDELGLTRERIRQLETHVCDLLAHQPWTIEARKRVETALAEGPVPLATLADDPWWTAAAARPAVADFFIFNVLGLDARVIELDDTSWLSRSKAVDLEAGLAALLREIAALPLPTPLAEVEDRLRARTAGHGRHLSAYFRDQLYQRLRISDDTPPRVLAFGDDGAAELLAILRASPQPVHIDTLGRRLSSLARKLPDEVLHFGHGRIGLRCHFPDFEQQQQKLVPAALRVIEHQGPDRQWYCGELLDELRESHDVPAWMSAFSLAALIKTADTELRYLGRLRVVLPGGVARDRRIFVYEAIEQLLRDAGAPLERDVLLARLDQQVGTSEYLGLILNRSSFVRVDADRIGLMARDVPGGDVAISAACELAHAVLATTDHGISAFHIQARIAQLSATHATWTPQLAMSVLRADGRFRTSASGAVGLVSWESTRVPPRIEILRRALAEGQGRAAVETVLARIEEHYGDRPTRATLGSLAMSLGAGLDGEWISHKATTDLAA